MSAAYGFIVWIHVGSVILSLAGFAGRGLLMLGGSTWLEARTVRIVPHLVDTVLLASGVWLAWFLKQYPFVHGWLTAKVIGLLAYIVLGAIALRRGRTRRLRAAALAGALLTAAYIVSVALTRNPLGALAFLS
jgi:uncharacterized membrane protein SirB2